MCCPIVILRRQGDTKLFRKFEHLDSNWKTALGSSTNILINSCTEATYKETQACLRLNATPLKAAKTCYVSIIFETLFDFFHVLIISICNVRLFYSICLPILFVLSVACIQAVDINKNGFSDAWEHLYNADSMELLADLDGDSFSNLEESIAGTDPRDGSSQPSLIANIIQDDSGQIRLSFQSLQGKHYTVSNSLDLANYTAIHPAWLGDNAERIIQIQTEGTAQTTSPIRLQYWGNLSATSIQDLYDLETYPNSPDGSTCIQSADAPQLGAAGYGARMTLWFEPPNDGDYTFFLSSGGPAELYLHAREGLKSSSEKVAEILPAQTGLGPQEWETYGSQRSALQALEAESRYLLDLRFVSIISRQHAQLAWSGPGIDGIQPVSMEHLAPIYFHTSTRTGATLLEHDYDSSGQTGKLWPNITDIDDYVGGLSGNAERTNRVAGSNSDKRLSIGAGTNKHLYATWIFKMGEGAQSNYLLFMNGSKWAVFSTRPDLG